jgi:hypothetical protein
MDSRSSAEASLATFVKDYRGAIHQNLDVYLDQLMRVADDADRAYETETGIGTRIRLIVYRIREDFESIR